MKILNSSKTWIITLLVAFLVSGLMAFFLNLMTAMAAVGWN
jgi:hypothetical protein